MTTVTSQTIAERASYDLVAAVQDVSTADVTSDYVSVAGFNRIGIECITDDLAASDAVSIQLVQATDASGTSSKNLGTAVSVTGTATTPERLFAEAQASDLDSGFTHVGVTISATPNGATTINAGAVAIRADGAYRP